MATPSEHPALRRLEDEDERYHNYLLRFAAYPPGRKYADLAQELGVAGQTISRWARQYQWKDRLAEYDRTVLRHETVSIAQKRQEIVEKAVNELDEMFRQLMAIIGDKHAPANIRLQAIRTGFELAGMFIKDVAAPTNINIRFDPSDVPMPEGPRPELEES